MSVGRGGGTWTNDSDVVRGCEDAWQAREVRAEKGEREKERGLALKAESKDRALERYRGLMVGWLVGIR